VSELIRLTRDDYGFASLALNRPRLHNAFNDELVARLSALVDELGEDNSLRGIVLTGTGKSFSAGADLNWMRAMVDAGEAENRADALRLAGLLRRLNFSPKPTIARINGAAFGGGVGLIACCDIAIAAEDACFGLSEVKLGLVPAVISPYLLRKIGEGQARRFFLSGERFDARTARDIGLIHQIVPAAQLDQAVAAQQMLIRRAGPQAVRRCKELIQAVAGLSSDNQRKLDEATAQLIAELRVTPEAQAGMAAFLAKRDPEWVNP